MAGVFRVLRFVKYLGESAWDPIVVSAAPGPHERPAIDRSLAEQVPESIEVHRTGVWRPAERLRALARREGGGATARGEASRAEARARGPALAAANGVLSALLETPDPWVGWIPPAIAAARRLMERRDPAVILSTSPPHSSHLAALVLHHLTRKPLVLDFRDPWVGGSGASRGGPSARAVAALLERRCVTAASRVVLNTPRLLEDFRARYRDLDSRRFAVVPNGFDPDLAAAIEPRRATRGAVPRLCHPGTVYGSRDLLPLVEALARLARAGRPVALDQVGNVAQDKVAPLEAALRAHGLEGQVRLHGRVSHRATLERMAAADAFVVSQPAMSLQVPGKVYEMLAFRRPILVLAGEGATADLVQGFGLGSVADPTDPAAIAVAIGSVLERDAAAADWDGALRAHDGRELTARLAQLLDEACSA
jgi:glycosyltransferase involved in cell wall biosynthesis